MALLEIEDKFDNIDDIINEWLACHEGKFKFKENESTNLTREFIAYGPVVGFKAAISIKRPNKAVHIDFQIKANIYSQIIPILIIFVPLMLITFSILVILRGDWHLISPFEIIGIFGFLFLSIYYNKILYDELLKSENLFWKIVKKKYKVRTLTPIAPKYLAKWQILWIYTFVILFMGFCSVLFSPIFLVLFILYFSNRCLPSFVNTFLDKNFLLEWKIEIIEISSEWTGVVFNVLLVVLSVWFLTSTINNVEAINIRGKRLIEIIKETTSIEYAKDLVGKENEIIRKNNLDALRKINHGSLPLNFYELSGSLKIAILLIGFTIIYYLFSYRKLFRAKERWEKIVGKKVESYFKEPESIERFNNSEAWINRLIFLQYNLLAIQNIIGILIALEALYYCFFNDYIFIGYLMIIFSWVIIFAEIVLPGNFGTMLGKTIILLLSFPFFIFLTTLTQRIISAIAVTELYNNRVKQRLNDYQIAKIIELKNFSDQISKKKRVGTPKIIIAGGVHKRNYHQ
jgi:hypothetical protein